jgi:MFS family permease
VNTLQRKVLGAVSLHHACNDASVVALPAIFPLLYTQKVLIKRYSDIGTLMLVGLLVAVLSQFVIGHKVKGRHYRYSLALDTLIVGISLLLMTLSRNYLMLFLIFIGVRLGTSIYHPVGISWISKTFTGRAIDRAMGFQSAFGDIGVLAAFATTGFLTESFGWKAPLLLWGSVNLVVLVTGLSISRRTADPPAVREESAGVSWRETIRGVRHFIPLLILGGMAWGVTLGYAPSLLNHKLGISMKSTGIILGAWMAAGALASLSYGRVSEKLGRHRTIMIAYAVTIVTAFTLGFSGIIALTVTAFILYGMSMFIIYPAILSLIGSSVEAKNRTATFSTVSNFQIIGNSVFSFISGHLSDAFGIHTPFLMLGSATCLITFYMAYILSKGKIRYGPVPAAARPKDIVTG